jgi:hypothetical protein
MTQTMSSSGTSLFFPKSYATGADGAIVPPSPDEAVRIVAEISPDQILLFTKRLINQTKNHRKNARYTHVNRARLLLAKACIDRYLDIAS